MRQARRVSHAAGLASIESTVIERPTPLDRNSKSSSLGPAGSTGRARQPRSVRAAISSSTSHASRTRLFVSSCSQHLGDRLSLPYGGLRHTRRSDHRTCQIVTGRRQVSASANRRSCGPPRPPRAWYLIRGALQTTPRAARPGARRSSCVFDSNGPERWSTRAWRRRKLARSQDPGTVGAGRTTVSAAGPRSAAARGHRTRATPSPRRIDDLVREFNVRSQPRVIASATRTP